MAREISRRAADDPRRGARSRLTDVAARAGVSTMTVTRVLRQPNKVSPETLARVTKALEAVQYVPDLLARALASRRTGVVAAIVPTLANSLIAEVMQGMSGAFAAHERQLMVGVSNFSATTEEALVRTFLARRVDAIYLTGTCQTPATIASLRGSGIPVVQGGNIPDRPIDMAVGSSNFVSSRELVACLIERYGTRMAFIGGSRTDNDRMNDRRLGFEAALRESDARPKAAWSLEVPISMQGGRDGVSSLLCGRSKPRAIFCANDVIAAGAVFECLRRGARVPEDIAIAGYDDLEIAGEMTPGLTTVRIPRFEIGVRAAAMIDAALAGDHPVQRIADMGFEIVQRESA